VPHGLLTLDEGEAAVRFIKADAVFLAELARLLGVMLQAVLYLLLADFSSFSILLSSLTKCS